MIKLIKTPEHQAARRAVAEAKHDLEQTKERTQEINTVVEKAARYGAKNNFAEMIREALGGTR